MKIILRQFILGFLLVSSGVMYSQFAMANEGYGSVSIVKIDKTKKIIDFGDVKFKYDQNTIVYDVFGKKLDISDLQEGMSAKVGYNPAQRFVGYPTLKALYLKSVIE